MHIQSSGGVTNNSHHFFLLLPSNMTSGQSRLSSVCVWQITLHKMIHWMFRGHVTKLLSPVYQVFRVYSRALLTDLLRELDETQTCGTSDLEDDLIKTNFSMKEYEYAL